jgi:hypothetical protein
LIFLDVDYGFKKEKSLSFVTQLKKSFAIVWNFMLKKKAAWVVTHTLF